MKYTVVTWPESQEYMERKDAIFIESLPNSTYAVPDTNGDYTLVEWPESQELDGIDLGNGAKLINYEPIKIFGKFKDGEVIDGFVAAIGQCDGNFDDEQIFYWFDDTDMVVGEHEDFIVDCYIDSCGVKHGKVLYAYIVVDGGIIEIISSFNTREQAEKEALKEVERLTKKSFESYDDLIEYQEKNLWGLDDTEVFIKEIEHFGGEL